jgi:outer membrane protein OmpU
MRKILLSTSAMIGLAFATGNTTNSVANNHTGPELKITGKTTVSTYFFNADKIGTATDVKVAENKLTTRVENSKIKFNVQGSTEAFGGLDYSLLIALSGDTSKTKTAGETVIKLGHSSYGELYLGDTQGPDGFKKLSAQSVLGGLGGFSGDINNIINVPGEVLWSNGLEGSPSKSTKIVYISPRIEGFQLGVSFTPNTQQKGSTSLNKTRINKTKGFDKNNLVGLLSYQNTFNGINVGLSGTVIKGTVHSAGQYKKNKKGSFEDTAYKLSINYGETLSWAVGGKIGYYGWEVGAEYIDNKKSYSDITHFTSDRDSGKITNVGVSYKFGQSKVSAGYYHSEKNIGKLTILGRSLDKKLQEETAPLGTSKAQIFSLTYDYKVNTGLSLFAEANHFQLENSKTAQKLVKALDEITKGSHNFSDDKNTGQVILVGTKVSF